MKKEALFLTLFLFGVTLATYGQTVSPRTGNLPKKQIITKEEFEKKPPEIQKIMKDNPDIYIIQYNQDLIVVSREEFNQMPQDKKDYILNHPEEYIVEPVPGSEKMKHSSSGNNEKDDKK